MNKSYRFSSFGLILALSGLLASSASADYKIVTDPSGDLSVPQCTHVWTVDELVKDGRRTVTRSYEILCPEGYTYPMKVESWTIPSNTTETHANPADGQASPEEEGQQTSRNQATSAATGLSVGADTLTQSRLDRQRKLVEGLRLPPKIASGDIPTFQSLSVKNSFKSSMNNWFTSTFPKSRHDRAEGECSTFFFRCIEGSIYLGDRSRAPQLPKFMNTATLVRLYTGNSSYSLRGFGDNLPAVSVASHARGTTAHYIKRANSEMQKDTVFLGELASQTAAERASQNISSLLGADFGGHNRYLTSLLNKNYRFLPQDADVMSIKGMREARSNVPWLSIFDGTYWKLRSQEDAFTKITPSSPQGAKAALAGRAAIASAYEAMANGDGETAIALSEIAEVLASIATDFVPLTAWPKAVYEMSVGEDFFTGDKLSAIDRGIAVFGVVTFGTGSSVKGLRNAAKWFIGRDKNGEKYIAATVKAADAFAGQWRRAIGISRGSGPVDNLANFERLKSRLAQEEAFGILISQSNRRFAKQIPEQARLMLRGQNLRDMNKVKLLTSDGSNIKDWGYYSYQYRGGRAGTTELHFYWNEKTKKLHSLVKMKIWSRIIDTNVPQF